MPLIQIETSLAANSTTDNILAGSAYEFLPWDAAVEFGLVGSATGIECTVQSGSDVLMEASPISIQNRFPIYPDDFTLADGAPGGAQLKVRAQNTTGGALTLFTAVKVSPL